MGRKRWLVRWIGNADHEAAEGIDAALHLCAMNESWLSVNSAFAHPHEQYTAARRLMCVHETHT